MDESQYNFNAVDLNTIANQTKAEETTGLLEKVRQQFEFEPYPAIPLDRSPRNNPLSLYIHTWITPYYLRYRKTPQMDQAMILDVGCGSGYTTLCLAVANPGAHIVAIDVSEKSVDMARQRLRQQGFPGVDFHVLSLEEIKTLNLRFDYINCDEVLYLLPDPIEGLKAMASVLKPQGIIRANLHSSLQRQAYFRIQDIFKEMGLLTHNPEEQEMLSAVEFVASLEDSVEIKKRIWPSFLQSGRSKEFILMNYLFQGDTGYSMAELFTIIKKSGLEFINMVNWRQWNLVGLFQSTPPALVIQHLSQLTTEEYLSFYERLNPVHRLLDFWCCPVDSAPPGQMVASWSGQQWERAQVQWHPQLNRPEVKEAMVKSLQNLQPFPLTPHLPLSGEQIILDCVVAAMLLPLFEGSQSVWTIVQRFQQTQIVDLVSLQINPVQRAIDIVRETLIKLEHSGYVLLTTSV